MTERTLLWVDLTLQKSDGPATEHFEDFFTIRHSSPELKPGASAEPPIAVCFEYDFPDRAGLQLLTETKRLHPSIPLLMLTVQHSEQLAVWAFRARVWDYFVKPVCRDDIQRCSNSLLRMERNRFARVPAREHPPLPRESRLRQFNSGQQRALAPAVAYVQSHYAEKIRQADVAKLCAMSPFRFSRLFHSSFGLPFQEYLLRFRIERAEELLLNPAVGISDVAYATGFRDVSYFGRVFRKLRDMSPSQWRKYRLAKVRRHPESQAEDEHRLALPLPLDS